MLVQPGYNYYYIVIHGSEVTVKGVCTSGSGSGSIRCLEPKQAINTTGVTADRSLAVFSLKS